MIKNNHERKICNAVACRNPECVSPIGERCKLKSTTGVSLEPTCAVRKQDYQKLTPKLDRVPFGSREPKKRSRPTHMSYNCHEDRHAKCKGKVSLNHGLSVSCVCTCHQSKE